MLQMGIQDPIARRVAIIYPSPPFEQRNRTIELMASIHIYSQEAFPREYSIYFIINQLMNSTERHRIVHWRDYIYSLGNALMMLPPLPRCTLFRGVSQALPKPLVVGNTVVWYGVTSMSSSIAAMNQFLSKSGPNTIFHVTTQEARDIARYSGYGDREREAVLPIQMSLVVRKTDCIESVNTTEIHLEDSSTSSPIPRIASADARIIEAGLAAERERVRRAAEEAERAKAEEIAARERAEQAAAGHAAEAAALRARLAELERTAASAGSTGRASGDPSVASPTMLPAFAAAAAAAATHGASSAVGASASMRPEPVRKSLPGLPAAEVNAFIKLVADGEQAQAEAMLRIKRALVLFPGDVRDLSGRTFNGITGFQYAVWALDWHMWEMLQRYMPPEAARNQALQCETGPWVRDYGVHAGVPGGPLNKFINELDTFTRNWDSWSWKQRGRHWVLQVGGAQRLLPTHVVNEYCHPTRSFQPTPNFTKLEPNARWRNRNTKEGEWFDRYRGKLLGDADGFAIIRGAEDVAWVRAYHSVNSGKWITSSCVDLVAVQALSEIRTQQRSELIAALTSEMAPSTRRKKECAVM
jgi:hypothetical protein